MLVAVTGGTGFVGAHTVKALVDAGHRVRVLVRREGTPPSLAALGLDLSPDDLVLGDVCDPETVDRLLRGSDAVLHAAGVVGTDGRDEEAMWRVNVEATATVLGEAVALGLDPIVHVSSYSALSPCSDPVMGPDSEPTGWLSAYGRTKAVAERIARGLQAGGAPVVTTYPSSVIGPPAGPVAGITAGGWAPLVRFGASVTFEGAVPLVDVRDLAAVHAAVMEPGRGGRRFLCGGTLVPFDEVLDLIADATGRPVRRVKVPQKVLRGFGSAADLAGRVVPLPPSITRDAATILTAAIDTDDSLVHSQLGIEWRPVAESLDDALNAPTAGATS